jgi:hypothetical protein
MGTENHRLTPEQVANGLRRLAEEIRLLQIATQLDQWANELSPPPLPEASRASHHSG